MFLLVGFMLLRCDVSRPQRWLVPRGYVGDVYVLVGYRKGVPPAREGLTQVFHIPANGILVTQDQPSAGWHLADYYEVDDHSRTELIYEPSTIPDTPGNRRDQRRIAWFGRGGSIRAIDLPCEIRYMQLYVGTPADLLNRSAVQQNSKEVEVENLVRRERICP